MIFLTSEDFYTVKLPSWIAFIIFSIIICIIYFIRAKNTDPEIKSQKNIYLSFVALVAGYMVTRIAFLFSDIERLENGDSQEYVSIVLLAYFFSTLAFNFLIYTTEKYLVKTTRGIPTLLITLGTLILLIMFFLSLNGVPVLVIGRPIIYIVAFLGFPIILFLYLYVAVKTTGELRKKAIITVIGMIIVAIGILSDSDAFTSSGLIPYVLPPILVASGLVLVATGLKQI